METWLYKIIILPEPRGYHAMSVVAEAKRECWEKHCEIGKVKRDDK